MSTTTTHDAGPVDDPQPAPASGLELSTDDLVAIATDVWACFLDEEVYPLDDGPAEPVALDRSVHASVGISGSWGGHVLLEMPLETAQAAARQMLQTDEVTPADVVDALGELSNMVGGNIKSLAPTPSQLGLPTVVVGSAAPGAGGDTTEIRRADLGWAAGNTVRISVWATNDHQDG